MTARATSTAPPFQRTRSGGTVGRESGASQGPVTIDDLYAPPSTKRSLRRAPDQVIRALRITWHSAPAELILVSALDVLTGAGSAAQVLVARELLEVVLGTHGHLTLGKALPWIIAIALVTIGIRVATTITSEVSRLMSGKVEANSVCQVADSAAGAALLDYERPEYHNLLLRAQLAATSRPVQMTASLTGSLAAITAIAGIGAALIAIAPPLLALIAVGAIPVWYTTRMASRALYRFSVAQTERDRRRNYIFLLLTHRDTAAEVRAFSLFGFLRRRLDALYAQRLAELAALVRRRVLISTLGGLASAAVTLGTLVLLIWMIVHGHLSIASAGAAAGAVVLLGGRMHGLGSGSASLYENALYMQDFSTFVKRWPSLTRDAVSPPLPAFSRLDVRDVSFSYPSRSTPVLQGVTMEIRRGEVVALVGENGSGKTTLAKILAGLYLPTGGSILWDGVSMEETDAERLRRSTAAIFQEYGRYMMTAGENIAIGDVERTSDVDAIVRAARQAQADRFIEELPDRYDNMLGSEYFGGANISLGQWQRIALARAYFRDAPFVILDEPTASLDPKAEAALFRGVRSLFEGRSVLLISHRFASVRDADRIYVLDGGRVIESGSHEDLMRADGKYAEMFRLQAAPYGKATTGAAHDAAG